MNMGRTFVSPIMDLSQSSHLFNGPSIDLFALQLLYRLLDDIISQPLNAFCVVIIDASILLILIASHRQANAVIANDLRVYISTLCIIGYHVYRSTPLVKAFILLKYHFWVEFLFWLGVCFCCCFELQYINWPPLHLLVNFLIG